MSYTKLSHISAEVKTALVDFYKTHTLNETSDRFSLAVSSVKKILAEQNIALHTKAENEWLKHVHQDGYDKISPEQELEIINYYTEHSTNDTCRDLKIKKYFLLHLLAKYNLDKHDRVFETTHSCLSKYGVDSISKVSEIKDKRKNTVSSKSVEEKAAIVVKNKQTKLKRYGSENYNNAEKTAQTNLEKYGVTNPFANENIKEKIGHTKLQRYGDSHFTNRNQARQTCLDKYGTEQFLSSEQAQNSIKTYNQNKYGVDYACQSREWQKQFVIPGKGPSAYSQQLLQNTGNDLYKQLRFDKEQAQQFIEAQEDRSIFNLAKLLDINYNQCSYWLRDMNLMDIIVKQGSHSHYEDEILQYIAEKNCIVNTRKILGDMEIDIYLPGKNLGIEFNGNYWHSSLKKPYSYHQKKSIAAEKLGIRLIHIWEYEWNDPKMQSKIKLMLDAALNRVSQKIYARQCAIKQITNKEARILNEAVHLQGHRDAQVTYGLFYQGNLVQLMSFSRTKYNRNLKTDNSWEIIRGCPGSNCAVIGGVSKLFKHFVKDYNPEIVFSYCDFNKFDGKSYEALGMKFIGLTAPDMKWWLSQNIVMNRCPNKHAELKKQAIAQLFGSGAKKYLWTNPNNAANDNCILDKTNEGGNINE